MKQNEIIKLPDGRHRIETGLFLIVRNDGQHRYYQFVYKRSGTRFSVSLGNAELVQLNRAKELALKYRVMLANGEDPKKFVHPNLQKTKKKKNRKNSFETVAMEAIAARNEVKNWKNPKHHQQWINTITTYAVPVLGDMDVATISRNDVLNVLRPIWRS